MRSRLDRGYQRTIAVLLCNLLCIFFAFSLVSAQEASPVELPDSLADTTLATEPLLPPPAPATNVSAEDTPNDAGKSITVTWGLSPDDNAEQNVISKYVVLRGTSPDGPFDTVGTATAGTESVTDGQTTDGIDYYYQIVALSSRFTESGDEIVAGTASTVSSMIRSSGQWFHSQRLVVLIGLLIVGISILIFIELGKRGRDLYVRPIAGLIEVEQAVGRATEMGRKLVYVPGTQDMDNVQTLAGVTILGRIAKLAAEYDAQLDVPVSRSLVMVTAREVVKEAYLNAGRPDAFNEDMVRYLTDDQFGYAAAIDGLFVREKPATVFYLGAFYAESLILAETGNAIGAIQIAGTAMPAQLPFFVAACDYTLIGEELFAASAYLSGEAKLLGSLKGQDVAKVLIIGFAILGAILGTMEIYDLSTWFRV